MVQLTSKTPKSKVFASQTKKWLSLVSKLNSSLKELGDVENWAKAIEADVEIVVKVLKDVSPERSHTTIQ
ncbi:GCN5-like protein 1-domain-containing protein [Obelidium mucronatum]|nr:GCN5-like protein 1-domain-containing protein [Obelidium mucronatum]